MVSSATAAELRPGTLATSTPLAAAAVGGDGVGPGPGTDDQGEPVGVGEDTLLHLGAADHQDVEPLDAVGEVGLGEAGVDHALVTPSLELLDGGLGERVGDEDAQPSTRSVLPAHLRVAFRHRDTSPRLPVTVVPGPRPHHEMASDRSITSVLLPERAARR